MDQKRTAEFERQKNQKIDCKINTEWDERKREQAYTSAYQYAQAE